MYKYLIISFLLINTFIACSLEKAKFPTRDFEKLRYLDDFVELNNPGLLKKLFLKMNHLKNTLYAATKFVFS